MKIYGMHIKLKNTCLSENNPHICIGWSKLGDLSNYKTKEEIIGPFKNIWPYNTKNSVMQCVGIINRFKNETEIGDLVLFRNDDEIYIGKITSDYFWNDTDIGDDPDYKSLRKVEWIKSVSKDLFPIKILNSLGSAMSYFNLTKYKEEVENILNDKYLENNEIYENLKKYDDIDPLKYDGSYELVRKVVEAYTGYDQKLLFKSDLELIYYSALDVRISTFQNKRERVLQSHLPDDKKRILYDLINNLEKTYKNGGLYKNNYLGIFDTGVEALKVSDENSRKLIDLFIKINCLHGFDNCYRCLNESFINNIKGIKTKVISPILHCLKPNYFPILNSACISSKIFESLGIGINSPYEISTYISNILKIMNFRDKNFKFKNYRIFEIEANKKIQFEDEYKTIYAYITDSSILTCSTQIVTKDWMERIAEPKNKDVLNLLIDWYNAPNHEMSCEEANDNFKNLGKDIDSYNLILKFCNEVNRDLKITIKKDDTVFNYLVLVDERNGIYKENQVKSWILKTEICEALESLGIVKKIESSKFIEKYTIDDFLHDVFISKEEYNEIYRQLVRKKNVILQGSPGVGKSYMAKKLAFAFMGEKNEENIEMVQFHQSYSYEDFIYGYKPNGNEFKLTPGIFYSFCKKAEKSDKPFFFIIDEINRGNLSKIFGELLMLIESDKRENCSLTLSHSKERFSVPSNLYIIGLMNTADRSLAIIDYALRRRFAFIDVNPAFNSEKFKEYLLDYGTEEAMVEKVINRICELNKTIEEDLTLGKNFEIGHSYFCDTNQALTEEKFKEIIKFDIIPILKEYWFDNPNKAKEAIEKLLD